MIIQTKYVPYIASSTPALPGVRQGVAAETIPSAALITISQAARDALASSAADADASVDTRLAAIKAKGPLSKTAEDMDYLYANDAKLATILEKSNNGIGLTSSEIDYQQKTIGFVNTMAFLSPGEQKMYDDMLDMGNPAAASALADIAFVRTTMGHTAGGAEGTTYDPIHTEITAENVTRYFRHTVIDKTGASESSFQALIQYLQRPMA